MHPSSDTPTANPIHGLAVSRSASSLYREPFTTRVVHVATVAIGGPEPVLIAGPCTVESRDQTLRIADAVAAAGAHILRGGAFKPRTSPHAFQGLGEAGLDILCEARDRTGLPIVTEVLDPGLVPLVAARADMLQIGSRSMQNTPLLRAAGATGLPILLKRGFGNSVYEWLLAAEHVAATGNQNIVLCERGIRTFADGPHARSTLDLAAVRAARRLTPLPVIVDPSHAAGRHDLVPTLALAGLAAGAQGTIIEVVADAASRASARCDGAQGVLPETLAHLARHASALSAFWNDQERARVRAEGRSPISAAPPTHADASRPARSCAPTTS